MEEGLKLYMLLLGCELPQRNIEQHDIFFGIGRELKDLLPAIYDFWPDGHKIHLDSWREVTRVDQYAISIVPRKDDAEAEPAARLFFINLGGYKPGDFEEYH